MGEQGCLYWITGLSGAGKTTVASALCRKLRASQANIILLDGDELRQAVAGDLGYTEADRLEAAMRYARICAMLAKQGLTVVIGTISMYHAVRDWNRANVANYCEVYLKVPLEVLEARNQKKLYTGVREGQVKHVVGMDMKMEEPRTPDLVIPNDGSLTVEQCVERVMAWHDKHQ